PDKIREVIGSGGKVIRGIVEESGAKVDINDDGVIKIASANAESIQKAYDMIYSIVAEPEEGKIYKGKVVKIVDFGAFVNFFGKRDGLVLGIERLHGEHRAEDLLLHQCTALRGVIKERRPDEETARLRRDPLSAEAQLCPLGHGLITGGEDAHHLRL
ncbi:MAG: KH domain-containing protein, partial [Pseudomonadota bacterium]